MCVTSVLLVETHLDPHNRPCCGKVVIHIINQIQQQGSFFNTGIISCERALRMVFQKLLACPLAIGYTLLNWKTMKIYSTTEIEQMSLEDQLEAKKLLYPKMQALLVALGMNEQEYFDKQLQLFHTKKLSLSQMQSCFEALELKKKADKTFTTKFKFKKKK